MSFISRIWHWIVGSQSVVELPEEHAVSAPRQKREQYGAHYYFGDILNQLNNAVEDLALLRRAHPDAYELHRKLGIAVVSGDMDRSLLAFGETVEPFIVSAMPAFAGVFCGREKKQDDGKLYARFLMAQKIKHFEKVAAHTGTLYEMIGVWKGRGKEPFVGNFFVSVDRSGNVAAVKVPIQRHMCGGRGREPFVRTEWDYPQVLKDIADENDASVDRVAHYWFTDTMSRAAAAESGIKVRARRGTVCATFAIDMLRTPYFFKDRIKAKNENGNTRPVFHYVKGHKRLGKFIKPHFRGMRRFRWHDFDVSVSMPGRDYGMVSEFDAGATYDGDGLTAAEVGEIFDRVMDRGQR